MRIASLGILFPGWAMFDQNEAWRVVPPEEKLALMAQAHSAGFMSAVGMIAVAGTVAVALQVPMIFWGALFTSPLVFQFSAGKTWRTLRPKALLEYLAARSAGRRYAFTRKAQDLGISLMFRGWIKEELEQSEVNDVLAQAFQQIEDQASASLMWIVLLNDSVIVMSEQSGGARLEFGQLLNDKLTIEAEGKEYSNDREVILSYDDPRTGSRRKFRVTSPYPGCLNVFEKRMLILQKMVKIRTEREIAAAAGSASPPVLEFSTHS